VPSHTSVLRFHCGAWEQEGYLEESVIPEGHCVQGAIFIGGHKPGFFHARIISGGVVEKFRVGRTGVIVTAVC
jgi:hypothetical protein